MNTMKKLLSLLVIFGMISCAEENTDVSVEQEETPVIASVTLDTIPPMLDTFMFEKMAFDCFFHLGYPTGGTFNYKSGIESVHTKIIEIINESVESKTDLVLLVDKTGSMQNDIDSVRININKILDVLQNYGDVQIKIAAYGDKNEDGPEWWSTTDLSADYTPVRNFINTLKVSNGGDYPESVYDGIANVVKETSWRADAKKMILVIGDAPSLEGSLSDHSRSSILELCKQEGVNVNLFPILVTYLKATDYVDNSVYSKKMVKQIYPNPIQDKFNIEFKEEGTYQITVLDLSGIVVYSEKVTTQNHEIILPSELANGTYVVRVFDEDLMNMNAEKIVVQR